MAAGPRRSPFSLGSLTISLGSLLLVSLVFLGVLYRRSSVLQNSMAELNTKLADGAQSSARLRQQVESANYKLNRDRKATEQRNMERDQHEVELEGAHRIAARGAHAAAGQARRCARNIHIHHRRHSRQAGHVRCEPAHAAERLCAHIADAEGCGSERVTLA